RPELVLDVASDGLGAGSVQVSPSRAFCDAVPGSTQTCIYPFGGATSTTLTAVPSGLSVFSGWSGDCSGTGPCTVNVSVRHAVRAPFGGPVDLLVTLRSIHYGGGGFSIDPPSPACESNPCRLSYRRGTVVTLTGFEGGPLDTFSWVTPPCGGTFCTLVMDRSRSLDAEVSEIDYSVDLVALAGPDQRVPLGTPLTLEGYVYSQFGRPLPPLSYAWWDDTTGEYLGYTATITPTLGFGLHDLTFYASDDSGGSAWDQVRVLVHDP